MATVEDRVKHITARVLKLDAVGIKSEDYFTVDLGAQSIQSVELLAAFEEEFGIDMDEEAALSVQTVSGAVDFINKMCQEQSAAI